jgi:DNA-directed RNA polymerase subunit delta
VSLKQLSKEELNEKSLIELAYQVMEEKKKAYAFSDLVKELAGMLDLTKDEIRSRIVQFYTDINIDGRFLSLGENRWGLRIWYPYDQIDEEVAPAVKSKKKKAKKVTEDEEDLDLMDDDLDYDDLDDFEEDDLIDEEDEDDDEDESDSFVDLDDDTEEEEDVFEEEELIGEDDYDLDVDEEDEEEEEDFDDKKEEK